MTTVSQKSRDRQRQATALKLLKTSLQLFDRIGFEATTVDRIVEVAGVAKGTFFHHFASKDAVLAWVGGQQIRGLEAKITRHRAFRGLPFEEQIRFIMLTLGEAHSRRKGLIRFLAGVLMKGDLIGGPQAAPIAKLEAILRPLVTQARERGEVPFTVMFPRANIDFTFPLAIVRASGGKVSRVFKWLSGTTFGKHGGS